MADLMLTSTEAVTWRWLLQTVLLSLGLTLGAVLAFRHDALSRRGLGVAAVWILALLPVLLLVWQPRYQIGVLSSPDATGSLAGFFSQLEFAGLPAVLLLSWLLCAAVVCLLFTRRVWCAARDIRKLPPLSHEGVLATTTSLSQRLQISTPAIATGQRCCASSIGSLTLVVPEGFQSWPLISQRAVIAHELVHLARRDDRLMVAMQFIARWYLFCPWLHALYARFVDAIEEACDERAAELLGSRTIYLEGLAEAALHEGGSSYQRPETTARELSVQRPEPDCFDERCDNGTAALINRGHRHAFMRRLARLLGEQKFYEVQSGPLTAGLAIGLFTLAALTTFELVPVTQSVEPLVSRVSVAAAPALQPPAVNVITRFPSKLPVRQERLSPSLIYPGRALIDHIEGEVLVEFSIAADGSTARPRVVRSSHPNYLDQAAVRAVKATVYNTLSNAQTIYKTGFTGVITAQDLAKTGELLAVRSNRSRRVNSAPRVQKLFLFRLNDAL